MNKFLKQFFLLLALLSSINIIAQDSTINQAKERLFNPKFSIGSGIYTLMGKNKKHIAWAMPKTSRKKIY